MCSWEVEYSDESKDFVWSRQNAEGLEELTIQGPPFDHDQLRNHFFVFASAEEPVLTGSEHNNTGSEHNKTCSEHNKTGWVPALNGGLPYKATLLKSPFLMSQEHPQECMEFWFFLQVNTL